MTLASLGAHPVSVVTALTVQDTGGMTAVLPVEPEWIEDQARALLEDAPVAAFKVGSLVSVEAVAVVAGILSDYPELPVVMHPTLHFPGEDDAQAEPLLDAWLDLLLPQATVLVIDRHEAGRLVGDNADGADDGGDGDEGQPAAAVCAPADMAGMLLDSGCEAVVFTGFVDSSGLPGIVLYGDGGHSEFMAWEALPAGFHGIGDTLSAAVAAGLAGGDAIADAVRAAREYTGQSIDAGYLPGMGRAVPDRFFWAREGDTDGPA